MRDGPDSGIVRWALSTMRSKQFVIWMAVFLTGFLGSIVVLEGFDVPQGWAFIAGMAFAHLSDPVVDWLTDWWAAEQEVEQYV